MRVLRFACVAVVVLALSVSGSKAADNAKEIVGKWELVKADGLPKGVTGIVEFTKDGKMKVNLEAMGQKLNIEGTYKVNGDKLDSKVETPDGQVKTDTDTIKKLDATSLHLVDKEGKATEFKRKK